MVKDGRFGPYVTDGETNATLRRDDDVETITPERGYELLAEKRAKGPAKKTAAKKAPAKKTRGEEGRREEDGRQEDRGEEDDDGGQEDRRPRRPPRRRRPRPRTAGVRRGRPARRGGVKRAACAGHVIRVHPPVCSAGGTWIHVIRIGWRDDASSSQRT